VGGAARAGERRAQEQHHGCLRHLAPPCHTNTQSMSEFPSRSSPAAIGARGRHTARRWDRGCGMSDLFSIANKVALVTGGSRGIGLMIARGYVEAGAKVYVSSRKKDACETVATELSRVGTCIPLPADCGTQAGCDGLARALAEREPALHILVNN